MCLLHAAENCLWLRAALKKKKLAANNKHAWWPQTHCAQKVSKLPHLNHTPNTNTAVQRNPYASSCAHMRLACMSPFSVIDN